MMFVNSNYFKLLVQNVPHLPSTATPHHEPRARREGRSALSCSRCLPRKAHDPGSRKPTAKTWEGLTATFSILKLHLQHGNAWKCQANHAQCHKFTKTIITKLHVDMPSQSISCAKCWTLVDITPVQLEPLMINSTQDDLARAAQVSSHLCRSKGGHPWHQKQKCSKRLPAEEISTQE